MAEAETAPAYSAIRDPLLHQVTIPIVDDTSCYEITVPGRNEAEGIAFLEAVGSGLLGSGLRMTQLGQAIPEIRQQYEARLAQLLQQKGAMEAEVAAGRMTREQYARWLFQQRRDIAYAGRFRQGLGATALLEARDWAKYGVGGRSWDNIYNRASARAAQEGLRTGVMIDPLDRIIQTATTPNVEVSDAAIRGAKFLRRAGPIFIVAGVLVDGYEIYSAPEGERGHVAGRVASEAGGGFLGGGLGVGVCIAFGIATSGWGLLACGAVGGIGGSYAGGKIYQSVNPRRSLMEMEETGMLDSSSLMYGVP